MSSTAPIALSGMNAAQLRLDSSAHNVANLQTENFRRQEVTQQESKAPGGVTASVRQAGVPGEALAQDMVEQISASYTFVANLKVIKTEQGMLGKLLDERT